MAFLLVLAGCGEMALRPTFPLGAEDAPVIHEQAILGFDPEGNALVAELIDAEGVEPALALLLFDRGGRPTRTLEKAPASAALQASAAIRALAGRALPLLRGALPEGTSLAALAQAPSARAFLPRTPDPAEPGRRRWAVTGAQDAGLLPLMLRLGETSGDPRALVLSLTERPSASPTGDEVELVRVPLSGASLDPELYLVGDTVWLLSGSTSGKGPIRRSVGVRRASLRRGEAELHNAHGLASYGAGELDAARREFNRAIAADPTWVDGLYNAAAAAALISREDEAIALLRRAVLADSRRVQVLGRNDEDFAVLRRRPEVRALLGLRRLPPEGVPPPP